MINQVIFSIALLAVLTAIAPPVFAHSHRTIDDNDTTVLRGNVHPHARPDFDDGPADYSLPMERMVLSLQLSPGKQAELDKFLAEQQDPASPNFHHWLTPEEFGEQFGPDTEDVKAVTRWLTSHGFTIDEVAKGRTWINFSGPVSSVERAFHTRIHNFHVNGKLHHANTQDPSIPKGFGGLVAGVVSMHDFPRKAMNNGMRSPAASGSTPDFTYGSSHYLSPGDFTTIYNVKALYSAGIDGTGQSIAIVGRTHPPSTNWTTFRSIMGLPANPPQVIVNGPDPGDLGGGEDNEADLDVEWSGAVARNATIKFVTSKSTYASDGVDLSAQYIVNNNIAPVMSTSFGACEAYMGAANTFYNNLWMQAAAQGITSFVSSGDSGASGCDGGSATSGSGRAVNGLSSTPYNVAVGGTQFNEGSGTYWSTSNGSYYTSVLNNYIPEVAWNESGTAGESGLWSTGGGASSIYAKPSWQVSPGVPSDGRRDAPDVSLSAAGHDGYLVQTQGGLYAIGGTSASSPSFAGLMALIVQKTGTRQGNANIRFYQLGNAQYASGGTIIFHDTTSGNNSVPSVAGYSCGVGYDLATGLGSVDANALVNNWTAGVASVAITSPASGATFASGASITLTASASAISPFTVSRVEFYDGTTLLGSASSSPFSYTWSNVPTGTYSLTAKAYDSLGGSASSSPVTVTLLPTYTNEILWRNPATGENYAWFLNGSTLVGSYQLLTIPPPWQIVGTGDFQGNGQQDILWRNPITGENWVWYMNETSFTGSVQLQTIPSPWQIVGVGDFNGDGKPDILWRNPITGENWVWIMNGTTRASSIQLFTIPSPWQIVGVGDFSGDGRPDIIWRNPTTGENWVWYMSGATFIGSDQLPTLNDPNWTIAGVGDYNNDGKPDILWRNISSGENMVWFMNGIIRTGSGAITPATDLNWEIEAVGL